MLADMPKIEELYPIPDAHVYVLKFIFSGVSIDLLYANVAIFSIPEVCFFPNPSINNVWS